MIESDKRKERAKDRFKFSREFRSLDWVKSEFKGSKVSNSLENLRERRQVATRKA
jgi:hypothetical protein